MTARGGVAVGAGPVGAAGGGGGAATALGAGTACAGAGAGMVALTAVLQAGDRLATFFCKHSNASLPPRGTPGHFDMKSERHEARIALCWSGEGCASAPPAHAASVIVVRHEKSAARRRAVIRIS